ncbi:MAG: gliding motility-associated-like protein [Bacteroidia bacterium]
MFSTWDFGDGNTQDKLNGLHTYFYAGVYSVSLLIYDENKCKSEKRIDNYIEVLTTPEVNIEADQTYNCTSPMKVNFSNKSKYTNSSDTYLWDFGDGTTSSDEHPNHTYTKNNKYTVTLTVTKANGCRGTKTFSNFITLGNITADFEISKSNGCTPMFVSFKNKTDPDISGLTYHWDFGNGEQSQQKNPTFTFNKEGTYTIKLTVSKGSKCTNSITKADAITVRVGAQPIISSTDTSACSVPFFARFNDAGTGAVKWVWLANGDTISQYQQAYNTFTSFGDYKVQLMVENIHGCVTKIDSHFIRIQPLKIEAISPQNGCKPLETTFTNISDVGGEEVVSQTWVFGDGSNEIIKDSSKRTVEHTYMEVGKYEVTLTVKTKSGCTGSYTLKVEVGDKIPPSFISKVDSLCPNESTLFTNTTQDSAGNLDSVRWYHSKTGPGSTMTYFDSFSNGRLEGSALDTGWYDVSLVTFYNGCKDTFIHKKQVFKHLPKVKIIQVTDSCFDQLVYLESWAEGADQLYWIINGKYTVYATEIKGNRDTFRTAVLIGINNASGCVASEEFEIGPVFIDPDFVISGALCAPAQITMAANATSNNYSYLWTYDSSTSNKKKETDVIENPGTYTISLRIGDADGGCIRTSSKEIIITGPTVDGSVSGPLKCGPVDAELTTTSSPSNYKDIYWHIGETTIPITSAGTVSHTFYKPGPNDGNWNIQLVGFDTNGCKGMMEFSFEVLGAKGATIKKSRFKSCEGRKFILKPEFALGVDESDFTYFWELNDGGVTSTLKAVPHTFSKPGVYPIKLIVTDEIGCVTVVEDTIDIEKEILRAKFNADSLVRDCPPLYVNFEDRSTLNVARDIVSWEWNFGDGTGSRERYPSKLYLVAGSFDIKLKVMDEWGCVDSVLYPGFVLVNGPEGSYTFTPNRGCVPHEVTFVADTTRCSSFKWDLGDGYVIHNQLTLKHVYTDTGRFIPLLTLEDTFGCTYTHPPIDTIYVRPIPTANFSVSDACPGAPAQFTNLSFPSSDITTVLWNFGDGATSSELAPEHIFAKSGMYAVKLHVESVLECSHDTLIYVKIRNIEADFTVQDGDACLGQDFAITDLSSADTTLVFWQWVVNQQDTSYGRNQSWNFNIVGPIDVELTVRDALGCTHVLRSSSKLIIGDTLPPVPAQMLRVSVENDESFVQDFKPSSILDFKKYIIYRDGIEVGMLSDRAETRFLHSGIDALHQVYCTEVVVENTCGMRSTNLGSSSHCTIEAEARGDTNVCVVSWNAYDGWYGIEKYYIYREKLNNPGVYSLLDSVPGTSVQYADRKVVCNTKHFYRIEGKERNGNRQLSWSDTCAATPIFVNTLPPNNLVRATVESDKYVLLEWDETKQAAMPIDHYIIEKSLDGLNYSILSAQHPANDLDLEDKNVFVDDASYVYRMKAVDVCDDVSPYSNIGKTILLQADTGKFNRPVLTWSRYQGWNEGVEQYEIQRKEEDESFVTIGYSDGPTDTTFVDVVTQLNERPHFCYRIVGHKVPDSTQRKVVSASNEDCILVHSWMYVPNAFTPNGDGINDFFVTPGWYIKDYRIRIYNRWGQLLFENTSLYQSWSGMYDGKEAESEAYVYIIETVGIDNIKRHYKGTVTLLR